MINSLSEWIPANPALAAILSIGLNIIIAITGVLPSTFITVGTVGFFGVKIGVFILIVGEAIGAIVSFILYQKGLHKLSTYFKINKVENRFLRKLKNTEGIEAFFIVILLRLLPFVPSGLVTITAAISKMNLLSFSIASTLGKIPSLYIETYSVLQVLNLKTEWQIGLLLLVIFLYVIYLFWKKIKESKPY